MLNKLAKLLPLFFVVATFSGCSYLPDCNPLSYIPGMDFSGPNLTSIEIQTPKSANCGTPFYVLVKSTDFPAFLSDDYQKISVFIAMPPENETSFAIACIVPGINQVIKVETPENKSLAVYCLFTSPGEVWKHIFELEGECQSIKIVLGDNEIISIDA